MMLNWSWRWGSLAINAAPFIIGSLSLRVYYYVSADDAVASELSDDGTRPAAAPRDALDASTASNVKSPGRRDGTAK